ncbi:Dynamin family protein [Streptomyces sp. TLI_053]|uniref:dynamin family protein n=1 Tax=Streptomyces sp. TLI_053 TaxID=1855352 RepID=UPI00087CEE74|nr:dynamin family protein [Streptomyces sp. TLI_053]SDS97838.1 Dynamin family protein [Streptomyces sp. TLI_053]
MTGIDTGTVAADTTAALERLGAAARARGLAGTAERLDEAVRRLADGRIVVVVCGEFNRGKSSLVNALVRRPGLLPVDVLQTTSVVTTLAWGTRDTATVHLREQNGGTRQREVPFTELADYVAESANPGNRLRAELLDLRLPSEALTGGTVLVDTPGIGGVFPEHTAVTAGFLASADAVVFVADTTSPLSAAELRFLRHALTAAAAGSTGPDAPDADSAGPDRPAAGSTGPDKPAADPGGLLVVLTRADQADAEDRRAMLDNTRAKLAALTGDRDGGPAVLAVSTRARLRHLAAAGARPDAPASADGAADPDSGYPEFESALRGLLRRRRASLLLARPLAEADAAVTALLRPLEAEREALARETDETLARLRASAEAGQREAAGARRSGAEWRTELRAELRKLRNALTGSLHDDLDAVWERICNDLLHDESLQDDADRLAAEVASAYAAVAGATAHRAETELRAVVAAFARQHRLGIGPVGAGRIAAPGAVRLDPDLGSGRAPGPMMPVSRDGSFGASMGAAVGGMLFGPAGAAVGGAIGLVAGLLRGLGAVRDQEVQARRRNLRDQLALVRSRQQRVITEGLRSLLDTAAEQAERELDSLLRQQDESAQETVSRLRAAAETTRAEAGARHKVLTEEHGALIAAGREVARLAALVAAVVDEPPAGTGPAGAPRSGPAGAPDEGPGAAPRPAPEDGPGAAPGPGAVGR